MNFIIYHHLTMLTLIYNISKNKFIKHNPPCKECLVQGMCIEEFLHSVKPSTIEIEINRCKDLIKFLKENQTFVTYNELTTKA